MARSEGNGTLHGYQGQLTEDNSRLAGIVRKLISVPAGTKGERASTRRAES